MSPARPWLLALFLAVGLLALLWYAPALIAWQLSSPAPLVSVTEAEGTAEAVDALLAEALSAAGATLLGEEVRSSDGVRHAVYQLPPGEEPLALAREIRATATARGLELYASPVDGLDAEVRAYAGAAVRQQLLLIPTLPSAEAAEAPRPKSLRERPLLAIIVAGLGDARAPEWLQEVPIPLTVAIRPYAPFSLRLAQEAALAWHEVLVDLSGHPAVVSDKKALAEAMAAVPFSSGLLSPVPPRAALPTPFAVLVQPDSRGEAPTAVRGQWVPAQRSLRRSAQDTLTRTRLLALRDGAAAIVLDLQDPGLEGVLAWAAQEKGFRIALASEVARADQVRGDKVAPKPAE